jgi:hypothetical protein
MDPSIIECSDQLVLRPSITRVDGRPVLTKTVAVSTSQGMAPVIEMVLRDSEGRPINFTSCGFTDYSSSSSSAGPCVSCCLSRIDSPNLAGMK